MALTCREQMLRARGRGVDNRAFSSEGEDACAARFTLVPAHVPALPVPLSLVFSAALIGTGALIWRLRAAEPAAFLKG